MLVIFRKYIRIGNYLSFSLTIKAKTGYDAAAALQQAALTVTDQLMPLFITWPRAEKCLCEKAHMNASYNQDITEPLLIQIIPWHIVHLLHKLTHCLLFIYYILLI